MDVNEAIILGVVQGVTEFLPISSDGHLTLVQAWLGFEKPLVTFDILLHLATLFSIVIFFRQKLLSLAQGTMQSVLANKWREVPHLVWIAIIGTLPVILAGSWFKLHLESLYSNFFIVSLGFFISGLYMLLSNYIHQKKLTKTEDQITVVDSLFVGFFQIFAILPGLSRSGSTIFSGKLRGFNNETAFVFSFLLAIPAILGAVVLEIDHLTDIPKELMLLYTIGCFSAFITGYIALSLLKRTLVSNKLYWFAGYCLILAAFTFYLALY